MKYGPLCKVSQWSGEKLVNVYLTLALQRSPKGEVAETIEKTGQYYCETQHKHAKNRN